MERAYEYSNRDKRKTIMYRDIANAVKEIEQLEFLKGGTRETGTRAPYLEAQILLLRFVLTRHLRPFTSHLVEFPFLPGLDVVPASVSLKEAIKLAKEIQTL